MLPKWPAWCSDAVPHAKVDVGTDAVIALKTERGQLDFSNQRAANCGVWSEKLRIEVAKVTSSCADIKASTAECRDLFAKLAADFSTTQKAH